MRLQMLRSRARTSTEFRRGPILIELWEPSRPSAFETEFSHLRVSHAGEKAFELRWDRADLSNIALFEQGDWEAPDPLEERFPLL